MARTKVKAKPMPQTVEELDVWVAKVGELRRQLDGIANDLNDRVAELTTAAAAEALPIEQELKETIEGVAAYAETHRDELTDGTKTVKLPSGELQWRFTPYSIKLKSKVKAEEVVAWLRAHRMSKFVRVKPEINREALLQDLETARQVPLIVVDRTEELYIRPNELEVEILGGKKKAA